MGKLDDYLGLVAAGAIAVLFLAGWAFHFPLLFTLIASFLVIVALAAKENGGYVYRRAAHFVPILLVVTFVTFCMTSFLPGDLAINLLGPGATPEGVAEINERLHLDDPIYLRYLRWIGNAVSGDLGDSPFRNEAVSHALAKALPISLQLMVYAQIVALAIGLVIGIVSAYKEGSRLDRFFVSLTSLFVSSPGYVIGPIMVIFFAIGGLSIAGQRYGFHWFPAARYVYFGDSPWGHFKSMCLPTLALAIPTSAVYARLLRTDMVSTLKEDFINVARAKGLSNRRILLAHALKPSSFTLLTVLGINVGFLIGNGLIVETIFTLPGAGTTLATAVYQRDYLIVQGGVVVLAIGYVCANFIVDLLYAVLDPRVRHARAVL